jgi:hypothetical protein
MKTNLETNSTKTAAPPKPTCAGTVYSIKAGDTCQSISLAHNVSTNAMLRRNGLIAMCDKFPTTGSICLEKFCDVYTVKQNETCLDVAKAHHATIPQLMSWNVEINSQCTNFDRLSGFQICVSNPGGTYHVPSISLSPVTVITTPA